MAGRRVLRGQGVGWALHPTAALVANVLQTFPVIMGHALWQTGQYVWCARCGAHGAKAPKRLKLQCRMAFAASALRVRDNLAAGLGLTARVGSDRIGAPCRFPPRSWLAFQSRQDGRPAWAEEDIAAMIAGGDVVLLDGEAAGGDVALLSGEVSGARC